MGELKGGREREMRWEEWVKQGGEKKNLWSGQTCVGATGFSPTSSCTVKAQRWCLSTWLWQTDCVFTWVWSATDYTRILTHTLIH